MSTDPSEVWAFDVDGTLVGSIRSDQLRPGARELLAGLRSRGVVLVLWSAGGGPYARRMADRHGIGEHFDGFYAKDGRDGDARYRTDHFAPRHRPAVFVDDSPIDLPPGAVLVGVSQFFGGNRADRALHDLHRELDRLLLER